MLEKNDDVRTMCENLNAENKKYVLAVAQALNFTQSHSRSRPNTTSVKPKKAS